MSDEEQDNFVDAKEGAKYIARVSIKIPPFWEEDPEIWFSQVEAQFSNNSITSDSTKYNYIVGSMEARILKQVHEVVIKPPEANKYESLKQKIIERFSASENEKISQLLNQMQLGNKRPSHLLNEMKSLAGDKMTDIMIKHHWISHLPDNVRDHVVASSTDMQGCAKLADDLMSAKSYMNYQINAQAGPSKIPTPDYVKKLEKQVEVLTQQMKSVQRSRSKSREYSGKRFKSPAKKANNQKICWYHQRFEEKATKCAFPEDCKFNSGNK